MFTIKTNHPVALESYDHLYPFGTIRDNHSSLRLVEKFVELNIKSVIDIGCAGGAFVEDLLNTGINAVGIEGSDISQKNARASWKSIPNNLFTADATRPFQILFNNTPFKADVITAWEFFEHILEEDLSNVLTNISNHSTIETQLLCSISNFPSLHEEVDLHRTKEELPFWLSLFNKFGFHEDENLRNRYERNYVRYGTHNLILTKK